MNVVSQLNYSVRNRKRILISVIVVIFSAMAAGMWYWKAQSASGKTKKPSIFKVTGASVTQSDLPVIITAKGTASAMQAVDVRPQISAVVKKVHIKEGQYVRKGDRLFTLDARTEEANLSKAEAQVVKDRADLANAERNLERERGLLSKEYISQSEFDAAQNLVDSLRGQLAIDLAALEASRVARSFNEIDAPISGRTGAISVYPGSLVQPGSSSTSGAVLVSITQLDPIHVSFTIPERELAGLQQAFAKGKVPVIAKLDSVDQTDLKGRLVFIDNAVDVSSGTIRLKAEFSNADHRLWPGMFVTVALSPRTITGALTVPVQAVQSGPDNQFIYVIGPDNKVVSAPIKVALIQSGVAVVEGIAAGTRVVVEGAQNLRPGSDVTETDAAEERSEGVKGTEKKSKKKAGQDEGKSK